MRLNIRQTPTLPAPAKSSSKGVNMLELSGTDVQPLDPPKGAPARFKIGRLAEATDFASWADLADLFTPLFRDAATIPASGPLRDEVDKIRAASTDPKMRASQALALVQDRVRYVALLMGQGSYVPASAETTWSRRFGDCKAKTALLMAILDSLGIAAEPVLVQSKLGDMIADRLPMIGLFNHVLVRAHVGGKDYWLDGTRSGDSDLDAIEVPDFGWGLPLIAHAQLVRMVPPPLDTPNLDLSVTIDASAGVFATAPITIAETYRGDSAVALNMLFSSATAAQRDQALHDKAQGYFDDFAVGSSSFQFDKAKRQLAFTIKGTAKLSWKDGWFNVPTSSIAFDPDFDRPAGAFRDAPVAVSHPSYLKAKAIIRLPTGLAAAQELSAAVHETLAGVEYARTETVEGNTLAVVSSERSIAPEVAYKDALAAEGRLRALNNNDVYLSTRNYQPTPADAAAMAASTPTSYDEYLRRGNLYLDSGKYDEAIADFTGALKLQPGDRWALADRALSYIWKRQFDQAEKDLAAASSQDPDSSLNLRARGLMAELKGDCAKAVDFYSRALAKQADNSFTLAHRAACLMSLNRYDDALAGTAEALKQSPTLIDLRVLRANIFMRQGKRDLVAGEAEAMIRDNPQSGYAFVAAAKTFAALGQIEAAMKAFDRALAITPRAYIYVNRAMIHPASDSRGRLADLDAALKLEPDNPDAKMAKAHVLMDSGDYKGALALLDSAKPDPNNPYAQIPRATVLGKAGRTQEARKLFDTMRSSAKTSAELNNLCWAKATAGILLESALQDCRDALKLSPGSGAVEDSLGMVLLKLGKLDEALDAYRQAIASNTGAVSLMGRAFVHLRKGDRAAAEADAAAARKLAPTIDDTFAGYGLKFDSQTVAAQSPH
jgi:tetratricopeptide (TPR) repeat protein